MQIIFSQQHINSVLMIISASTVYKYWLLKSNNYEINENYSPTLGDLFTLNKIEKNLNL